MIKTIILSTVGVIIGITMLIYMAFTGINLINRHNCRNYQDVTGRLTRYEPSFGNLCYMKYGKSYVLVNQFMKVIN